MRFDFDANDGPTCPDHFDDDLRRQWRELCESVENVVRWTAADTDAIARYVSAMDLWRRAERQLQSGFNAHWSDVSFRTAERCDYLSDRLGLNPLARARMAQMRDADDWRGPV